MFILVQDQGESIQLLCNHCRNASSLHTVKLLESKTNIDVVPTLLQLVQCLHCYRSVCMVRNKGMFVPALTASKIMEKLQVCIKGVCLHSIECHEL